MILEQKINNNLIQIVLAISLGLIVTIIIFSLNRGFDFTDEGGFLLSYKYANTYKGGIYNYHIIIAKLTNWFNPGILAYRWLSLILTLFSSFILSIGLYRWLKTNYSTYCIYKNFVLIFCFLSIGNFLFYFPGLQTIHNNTLTNFFIQVATGFVLYIFSLDAAKLIQSKSNLLILSLIGFICAFSFFVKFTTGFLQLTTYLIIVFLFIKKQQLSHVLIAAFTICFGFFVGVLIYFLFFQGYYEWIFNFKREYNILSDHSPRLLIQTYYNDSLGLIKFSLHYFSWLIIFPIFIITNKYYSSYFKYKGFQITKGIVLLLSVIFAIYEIYHFKFYRSTFNSTPWINAYFYIMVISFQLCILLAIGIEKRKVNYLKGIDFNKMLIVVLLLVTPFFGATGTANPIFLNALIHAAPWFGVIIILSIYLSEHIKSRLVRSLFIIIPGLVTTSQIIDGNIFIPYYSIFNNNKSDFFQQSEQVEKISLLNGISVDIKTKIFLNDLKQILTDNNYKKGYPIFGFHLPGVIYLLDGISPGAPYYFNKKRDCMAIESFKLQNNPPIIMVTKENPINIDLLNVMKSRGIIFPNNYLLKGEVYYPQTNSILKVYFPQPML